MKQYLEKMLCETLVSKLGLNCNQVQIKGDASIRETAQHRTRYKNLFDENIEIIQNKCLSLLVETGVYNLTLCCNSGEILTRRVYDPFTYEAHEVENFIKDGYIERHFPLISYDQKTDVIRKVNKFLEISELNLNLSEDWKSILKESNEKWEPMSITEIHQVVSAIKILREIDDFYLRHISVSISQGIIEMQFNCDGTVIVCASHFSNFMEKNI